MGTSRSIALLGITLSGCALFTSLDGFTESVVERDAGAADTQVFSEDAAAISDAAPDAKLDAGTGCDADLGSNPNHCGACGHDCLGGACALGACTAVVVVVPTTDLPQQSIAVRDGKIYWTYWGDMGTVSVATINGTPQRVASGFDSPTGIFVRDDGGIVVASYSTGILGTAKGLDAGLQTIASGIGNPGCFAVDGAGVAYVPDYDGGRILRVAGSTVTPLLTGQDHPWGVATAGGFIYWTTGDEVHRANVDGTAETTLFSGENTGCLAVDDKYLYWPEYQGNFRRGPRTGGKAETIGNGPCSFGVAVDDVSVYYTANGKIVRLAK